MPNPIKADHKLEGGGGGGGGSAVLGSSSPLPFQTEEENDWPPNGLQEYSNIMTRLLSSVETPDFILFYYMFFFFFKKSHYIKSYVLWDW